MSGLGGEGGGWVKGKVSYARSRAQVSDEWGMATTLRTCLGLVNIAGMSRESLYMNEAYIECKYFYDTDLFGIQT